MKFKIHISFFVFAILLALSGQFFMLISYLFVVFLHEMAHKIVAHHFGYKLDTFVLMPQGAKICGFGDFKNFKETFLICIAGPLCNFVLFFITVGFWWLLPESYAILRDFAFCNLVVGLFNLLPIAVLDGGQIVLAFFSKFQKQKQGKIFCFVFSIVFCLLFLSLFVVSIFVCVNFSYLAVAIFVFASIFESNKSGIYKQIDLNYKLFENKKPKNKVQCFVVYSNETLLSMIKKMNKNAFNVAYVISSQSGEVVANLFDGEIIEILKNNPLSKKIADFV